MAKKDSLREGGCIRWGMALAVLVLLLCGAGYMLFRQPGLAAQGADVLRAVFGDETVARIEMVLFQAQDTFQQAQYALGLAEPAPPWQSAAATPQVTITRVEIHLPETTPSPQPQAGAPAANLSGTPGLATEAAEGGVPSRTTTPEPAAAVVSAAAVIDTTPAWPPEPLSPLGQMEGEGVWSPYIQDAGGNWVACRTFLQPDPTRPFSVVAVIAFDLQHTRLHFILGFEEPYSPGIPARTGAMPESDKAPNYLLAMFNGGFKTTHGHFGAMADGITALQPRDGLGTLVISKDGRLRLGAWGSSIQPSDDMEAWRQNGPLVIEDGQINPRIYNNSPKDWGYTVNDVSPTWRSGIGLSPEDDRLYYFAGKSLTMEALAKSMQAAGAAQGMQLDINTYWVHFVAIRDQDGQRTLDPLFPEMMKDNISRYLYPYSRDYFYVTGEK